MSKIPLRITIPHGGLGTMATAKVFEAIKSHHPTRWAWNLCQRGSSSVMYAKSNHHPTRWAWNSIQRNTLKNPKEITIPHGGLGTNTLNGIMERKSDITIPHGGLGTPHHA
jgi:hypothetical protein